MAGKMENFKVVKWEPRRFIGKSVYSRAIFDGSEEDLISCRLFGKLWGEKDWIFKTIDSLSEYATDEIHNIALTTWERYDDKNQLLGYTVGRFMKANTPVPKYMDYIEIPEMYVAKATIRASFNLVDALTTGEYYYIVGEGETLLCDELRRQDMYNPATNIFVAEGYSETPDDNGNISAWEFYCACNLKVPQ